VNNVSSNHNLAFADKTNIMINKEEGVRDFKIETAPTEGDEPYPILNVTSGNSPFKIKSDPSKNNESVRDVSITHIDSDSNLQDSSNIMFEEKNPDATE
jgi:hypothetical protein